MAAERRRQVEAVVDLAVVPDPRAWLEARLGLLARYELLARHPNAACAGVDGQERDPAGMARTSCARPPVQQEETVTCSMQGVPSLAEAAREQPGLDPGAIYRGPVAWQPPDLLLRVGRRQAIQVPMTPPPLASPWLLLPTRSAPTWHDALDPGGLAEHGVVWWGPLRPVIAPELAGLAFRQRGGLPPAVTMV